MTLAQILATIRAAEQQYRLTLEHARKLANKDS